MRVVAPPWPVAFGAGAALGALVVAAAWSVAARAGDPGRVVDVGPAEAYAARDFPPVLHARDGFYLVKTEAGELRALYVYPPSAQRHDRTGCAIIWFAALAGTEWQDVFRDPCFGDTFGRDGARLFGPSPRDLDRFPVTERCGRVLVDTRRLRCDGPGPCRRVR